LDPLDIEGLSQLYRKTQDESSSVQPLFSNLSEPSISDWEAFLDTYRSSHHTLDHSNPLPSNLHYYIMAYLLSATFKDCSIMIGLGCSSNPITLIDLDPKSVVKLPEWEKLDKRIVEAYTGVEGRQCIDASKPIDKI
jgi:inositol-pentakisphosphate 2-kinase